MDFPPWVRENAAKASQAFKGILEPYTTPPIEVIANAAVLPEDPPAIADRRRFIGEHMGHALRRLRYAAIVGGSAIALDAAADINFGALAGPFAAYMGIVAHIHYRNAALMSNRLASEPSAITWTVVQPPTPQGLE